MKWKRAMCINTAILTHYCSSKTLQASDRGNRIILTTSLAIERRTEAIESVKIIQIVVAKGNKCENRIILY